MNQRISVRDILPEVEFSTSRSSGPGGQNVNKVNTKVTLRWDIAKSTVLTDEQKVLVREKLKSKLTQEGVLIVHAQEKRSQLDNKATAIAKLDKLLARAFEVSKPRKKTKPGKSAVQKRLSGKKLHSEKKKWRQRPE